MIVMILEDGSGKERLSQLLAKESAVGKLDRKLLLLIITTNDMPDNVGKQNEALPGLIIIKGLFVFMKEPKIPTMHS